MRTIIFVHPGYLRRTDIIDMSRFKNKNKYGDYKAYLDNLKILYNKSKAEKTMFFVHTINHKLHPFMEGLYPFSESKIIKFGEWMSDDWSQLIFKGDKTVITKNKLPEKNFLELLNSIDDVLIAGELAPYENSPHGCVGHIYKTIIKNKDIKVKGIKGCIYPTKPYLNQFGKRFENKLEKRKDLSRNHLPDNLIKETMDLFSLEKKLQKRLYSDIYVSPVELYTL